MTYWEWELVYDILAKYGYGGPLLDLGGIENPALPDYTGAYLGDGVSRTWVLRTGVLWENLEIGYTIHHRAELLAKDPSQKGRYGTIISTSVLEHVEDPRAFMRAVKTLLNGIAIIATVFRWQPHGESDYWRFTEMGLRLLANQAGMVVLETGTMYHNPSDTMAEPVYMVASSGRELVGRWPKKHRPKLVQDARRLWKSS